MIQFPGMPRKQIEIFDQYIVDNEYYNKKVKAIYRDWQKEKIQTKTFAEEQILNQIEYLIQDTEKELARMKTVHFSIIFTIYHLFRIKNLLDSNKQLKNKETALSRRREKTRKDWPVKKKRKKYFEI
jgi:hypothetical protein